MTAIADVTVVVPARDERENVCALLDRLDGACPELRLSVLFVDDSTDDTPSMIHDRARRSHRAVEVIHRAPPERIGGLGGAVCAGLKAAGSEWVCVMDADLQHPPELISALWQEASRSAADVVIASRYCARGELGGFSALRRCLSRVSVLAALMLFPRRLRGVSDPMSGFFLVRRDAVDVAALRPRGFKILLEILLRGQRLRTSDVAFTFGTRHAGDSKASPWEAVRYVQALVDLRLRRRVDGRTDARDTVRNLPPLIHARSDRRPLTTRLGRTTHSGASR